MKRVLTVGKTRTETASGWLIPRTPAARGAGYADFTISASWPIGYVFPAFARTAILI